MNFHELFLLRLTADTLPEGTDTLQTWCIRHQEFHVVGLSPYGWH